jgi:hypothetical protein
MGLAGGEPALTAVASVDAVAPATLPTTGGSVTNVWLLALVAGGLAIAAGGLVLRSRAGRVTVDR